MKVLHFSHSEHLDSVSRAACALNRDLQGLGVDSRMLVRKDCAPPDANDAALFGSVQACSFDHNARHPANSSFSIGYPGANFTEHPDVSGCDVIHLHQVAGFLSPAAIAALLALDKPVVWTLQDAWPFTGGCMQPGDCQGFEKECADCPQLQSDPFQLPRALLDDKRAHLFAKNITLLAGSRWLADAARASAVFRDTKIERLETERSAPSERTRGDAAPLSLLFVCDTPGSQVRVSRQLRLLVEAAQSYGGFRNLARGGNVIFTVLGLSQPQVAGIDLPIRCVDDFSSEDLARIFAGTHLMILPGIQENRPSIILEAQRHGIPVLAFDCAGVSEFIADKTNGRLAPRNEAFPMGELISYLTANPKLLSEMSSRSIADTGSRARELLPIYESAIQRKSPSRPVVNPNPRPELLACCHRTVLRTVTHYVEKYLSNESDSGQRLAVTEKIIESTDVLIEEAQRNLAGLRKCQQELLELPDTPASISERLAQIQKSTISLQNKLKWRSRRIKVFQTPRSRPNLPARPAAPAAIPRISPFAGAAHKFFLKDYWMKHGKKDQYAPRPIQYTPFPAPKLREAGLPRIAIVTPSFMQGDFIEQTILSVISQNYPRLAYAVQDGGSTDKTAEIIGRYADRLDAWASEPDSGQTRAILTGFEKVSGDIMAWLNSDDLLAPGSLRFVGEYFATHPDVDAVYGNRILIDEHGMEVARWVLPPHNPDVTRYMDQVPQETLFWRAALWEKVGGLDPSFRFAMDWDLILRFQNAGANLVHIPWFLGCFRVHSQQKTSAQMESLGAEEVAWLRWREHGRDFQYEDLLPYRRWLEVHAAIYSRLLEFGVRF